MAPKNKEIEDEIPAGEVGNVPAPAPKPTTPKPPVTFSNEQIAVINQMFEDRMKGMPTDRNNPNNPISVYNLRDPKKIETVKVSRFDAKWVVSFKNLQNDPYKKIPKYLRYGVDPIRKLNNEPYVTLNLSADGKTFEEKEVLLIDYMDNRDRVDIKVLECKVETKIHDHGILGAQNNYGIAVDEKGKPEARPTILAQSKSEIRTFVVQLPGFETTTEFSTDFLG